MKENFSVNYIIMMKEEMDYFVFFFMRKGEKSINLFLYSFWLYCERYK